MANYISSNANRFYCAIERTLGQAAQVESYNRFPADRLEAQQKAELVRRPDKTGTRTYLGQAGPPRLSTAFAVKSYLASWSGNDQPSYGPLIQSAMGGVTEKGSAKTVAGISNGKQLQTETPHELEIGSAISFSGEIRFVSAVIDEYSCLLNAPFTRLPQAEDVLASTVTYRLGLNLPSVTLYDFWDPATALSRIVTGAVVDRFKISVNGDAHELLFSGPAVNLLDSRNYSTEEAGLATFPAEPALAPFDARGVPGHLGQAWIGGSQNELLTLTEAEIQINNNIGLRNREFGSNVPKALVPGPRDVGLNFTLLAQDNEQTLSLYSSAKQRTCIPVMLQLGMQQSRVLGIYLPNVVPEIPEFDDSDVRLRWRFSNNLGQGSNDDELYIAFA